jgi:hypothetical protein
MVPARHRAASLEEECELPSGSLGVATDVRLYLTKRMREVTLLQSFGALVPLSAVALSCERRIHFIGKLRPATLSRTAVEHGLLSDVPREAANVERVH